ncbi:ABC transporter ATP-binding protein [Actinoplanes sp. NPDC051633]|uniref:ABC transporter ATP-binding protein n=1 Tax=Actinoplanes sp. NPDC051633 TaxID=3155670 RepID=UPI003439C4EE
MDILFVEDLRRVYAGGGNEITALDGLTAGFAAGTFTAVMGPSGSGKSTLLQCAAGLDRPTSGRVVIGGAELTATGEAAMTRFRRERVGFVFQDFNLMPALTVTQNVTLPLKLAGRKVDRRKVRDLLERLGLGDRLGHVPGELSGGQRQRVAIARALITEPEVVFADEPTGALDTRGAREVLELLRAAVRDFGRTVVMVTHDPVAAAYADAVLFLADGRIVGRMDRPTAERVAERLAHVADLAGPQRLTAAGAA